MSIAPLANGTPAYSVMWPNTSMVWSCVNPMFSAPRMWLRSGPSRPNAVRHVMVQMQRLVRASPGRVQVAPVVFSGDTPEFLLGFRWRSRPRRGGDTHVAAPKLLAPLEQAVGIFAAIVGAGRREIYPPQRLRYGCRKGVQYKMLQAGSNLSPELHASYTSPATYIVGT